MTALWAAQKARAVVGVMATTLLDPRDTETFVASTRSRWIGHVALTSFRLAPRLTGALRLPLVLFTPIEALTTGPELARALCRDPLIGRRWVPVHFFHSLQCYRPPRDDLTLPCPLLLVHPGADAWTPLAMSLPTYDRVPTPKELVLLSNGTHAPLESPAYAELTAAMQHFLDRTTRGSL